MAVESGEARLLHSALTAWLSGLRTFLDGELTACEERTAH